MSQKNKLYINIVFFACAAFILILVITMSIVGDKKSQQLLEESIESQLLSITAAAREVVDVNAFVTYNSMEDITNNPEYDYQLAQLRTLATNVGAKYIYALKIIDETPYFIFDTDQVANATFQPYQLSPVHQSAFEGTPSAGIMNSVDEFGAFNTGAIPLFQDGRVVGIIGADIEDHLVAQSLYQAKRDTVLVLCVLSAMLLLAGFAFYRLLNRIKSMQDKLSQMANYDKLTDLPNRRFLMNHLEQLSKDRLRKPFALFFIDMDNFKTVNDKAGHDAGDELLRHAAIYFQSAHENSTAFRPGSGSLNVTARIGGDEFVLVVSEISTTEEAEDFARKLISGFASSGVEKFVTAYNVGISVGIALFPRDTENYHVLINYADIAMYHAKRSGKNDFRVYTMEMKAEKE